MRVIVSAGGTGGHIYPALAIINKIKEEEPDSEFLYIGTKNRMEKDIVPTYGIKYKGIEVSGFKRKLTLDNIKTITSYLKARKECLKIIERFKPDVVIGTGGYVTGPVIWAAKKLKKKTFIHEQNSVVGLANKYLSRYADKIGVCFESAKNSFPKEKVYLTGNPCSDKAINAKKVNVEDYGLSKDKKTVLIVMGSLGSRTINEKIMSFIDTFRNKDYQVLFVVGKKYLEQNKKQILPSNVKLVSYIDNLPGLMKSVDVMVSRSGASTISEITAVGIPTIFIPSPYVTNNHQYKNAMDLVNRKAALIIEEKDLTKEVLFKQIDRVLKNEKNCETLKNNVSKLGIKNSSGKIYELLKDLILDDKRFFKENNIEFISNVNLGDYNTYHVNSKALGMVFPSSIDELVKIIRYLKDNNINYRFLGNGSNIILSKEYYDLIFIKLDKLNNYKVEGTTVIVEPGVSLIKLSLDCAKLGLSGLEFMCALPGHMGSSVAMNAGAYKSSISDVLVSAKVLNDKLEVITMTNKELEFKYRDSFLKHHRDYICLEATLELKNGNTEDIYELMSKRQTKRTETQPLEYPCAGSVFRNPEGLYAGELIEKCGLKGTNINGAEVSEKHANFIINKGGAKGEDIIKLIKLIKEKVYEKYKVELILEQEII